MDQRSGFRVVHHQLVGLLLAVAALVVLTVAVVVLPAYLAPRSAFGDAADAIQAQNDERELILQGLGGMVLLLGAYVTWRQFRVSREQLQHNLRATANQLRPGPADDRPAGSDHGAVHPGRRISSVATNSSSDWAASTRWSASRRTRQPTPPRSLKSSAPTSVSTRRGPIREGRPPRPVPEDSDLPHLVTRATDVQAALTVLARRAMQPKGESPQASGRGSTPSESVKGVPRRC